MEEKQHIYIYSDRKKRQQMNIGTLVLLLNQTQHQKKKKTIHKHVSASRQSLCAPDDPV